MHNSNHIFVNLSHILLKTIIKYLKDIDIICLSLVCKRWYNNRDSFLEFNQILISSDEELEFNCFKSYKNIYDLSVANKVNHILLVSEFYSYTKFNKYDYYLKVEKEQKSKYRKETNAKRITFDDLESAKITAMYIKSFRDELFPLFPNGFFMNITKLIISTEFDFKLLKTHFKHLEYLTLQNVSVDLADLPPSLLSFKQYEYVDSFPIGSLPRNLKELVYIAEKTITDANNRFPPNLTQLCINATYIKETQYLKYLTHLMLTVDSNSNLSPGDIPSTVTTINLQILDCNSLKQGVIPQSCTKLDIDFSILPTKISISSIVCNTGLNDGRTNIKKLTLISSTLNADEYNLEPLPLGITKLNLLHWQSTVTWDIIPSTVRSLCLIDLYYEPPDDSQYFVPENSFIERVEIDKDDFSLSLPPSVSNIVLSSRSSDFLCHSEIPLTIQTILVKDYRGDKTIFKRVSNDHFIMLRTSEIGLNRLEGGIVNLKDL